MENINDVASNAALFCGRMHFVGTELTVSVLGRGKGSLIETVVMFADYFTEKYPDKMLQKLELFTEERHMHEGKKAWQTTHFTT